MDSIDDAMCDEATRIFKESNRDRINDAGLSVITSAYLGGLAYITNSINHDGDTSLVFSSLVFSALSAYAAIRSALPTMVDLVSEYRAVRKDPELYLSRVLERKP